MEELKLEYYFKEMEGFRFKEVFEGCIYPWEALTNIKLFLQREVVEKDGKQPIKGEKTGTSGAFWA